MLYTDIVFMTQVMIVNICLIIEINPSVSMWQETAPPNVQQAALQRLQAADKKLIKLRLVVFSNISKSARKLKYNRSF